MTGWEFHEQQRRAQLALHPERFSAKCEIYLLIYRPPNGVPLRFFEGAGKAPIPFGYEPYLIDDPRPFTIMKRYRAEEHGP